MQTEISELPMRGTDAIEILTNDHQTIKSLLSSLTQGTGMSGRQETLERLKAALTIHNATEENLFYPALQVVAGKKSESQKLYHETADADVLVFQLDTMLKEGDDSGFTKTAEKLQAAVLEHIEDEEQKAFKDLREKAEPQQAQMLTQSVREFRSKLRVGGGSTGMRSETGEVGSPSTASRSQTGAGE